MSIPVLKQTTSPVYPKELEGKHLEAHLILQIIVKSGGTVGAVEALRCKVNKEHKEPEKSLERFCAPFITEATVAVSKWVFEPAHYNGEPVDVYWTVLIDFEQRRSSTVPAYDEKGTA